MAGRPGGRSRLRGGGPRPLLLLDSGGCGGPRGRPPRAAGSGLAAALGKGCVGSSSKDCDTAPLLQGLARLRARCPRHTAGVRSRPSSSSYTYHSTRRRCVPCSAALAPDWAPPMVVSSDPAWATARHTSLALCWVLHWCAYCSLAVKYHGKSYIIVSEGRQESRCTHRVIRMPIISA